MTTPFQGRERETAVLLLKERWSGLLETDPKLRRIVAAIKQHVTTQHMASREEALKIIIEVNCQSLREFADQLEETAAAFLETITKT